MRAFWSHCRYIIDPNPWHCNPDTLDCVDWEISQKVDISGWWALSKWESVCFWRFQTINFWWQQTSSHSRIKTLIDNPPSLHHWYASVIWGVSVHIKYPFDNVWRLTATSFPDHLCLSFAPCILNLYIAWAKLQFSSQLTIVEKGKLSALYECYIYVIYVYDYWLVQKSYCFTLGEIPSDDFLSTSWTFLFPKNLDKKTKVS